MQNKKHPFAKRSLAKHSFAIYTPNLSGIVENNARGDLLCLKDRELWSRLTKVLRLKEGDSLILFDELKNVLLVMHKDSFSGKGKFYGTISEVNDNAHFENELVLYCPVLKREAFEDIIYFASEVGVSKVVPILTDKVQRKWGGEKELLRIKKIIVAAAEQSKNFATPTLGDAITFKSFLGLEGETSTKKIFFDVSGRSFLEVLCEIKEKKHDKVVVTLGPEGDFSDGEKMQLKEAGFDFVVLTPTVLKSAHAALIGLGGIRGVLP